MSNHEFKVGDIVRIVRHSRWSDDPSEIGAPVTIAKAHKGNGNLIVDGAQFRAHGDEVGYTGRRLVLVGSQDEAELLKARQRARLVAKVRQAVADFCPRDASDETLQTLLTVLTPQKKDTTDA